MANGKLFFDETTGEIFIKDPPESGGKHLIFGEQETPSIFAGWTNSSWDTFTSSGIDVTSAIENTATVAYADTELVEFEIGDQIRVEYDLTLNSGTYPTNTVEVHLVHEFLGIQATATLSNAAPSQTTFTITDLPISMNFKLRYQNYNKTTPHTSNSSCDFLIYKL